MSELHFLNTRNARTLGRDPSVTSSDIAISGKRQGDSRQHEDTTHESTFRR